MIKAKHSKYKNSGLIFELLIRKLTSDTLAKKDSNAINIIKEYYINTEISKEYKLYKTLLETKTSEPYKVYSIIDSILNESKKINRTILKRQKYNLIKEIKNNYDLDDFFKTQIENYKIYASIFNLIEGTTNPEFTNPSEIIKNKETLIEHILNKKSNKEEKELIQEYAEQNKDIRILTYKILLEKFNQKYAGLDIEQKQILKEYITNVTESPKLRNIVNEKFKTIKSELTDILNKIEDKTIKIKLNETISFIKEIPKNINVKDKDILNLLQFIELRKELSNIT
jgi:hypothetical protein